MPAAEKTSSGPSKAGLQDDHDPNDIGQQQNNKTENRRRKGKLDDDKLPADDRKFG